MAPSMTTALFFLSSHMHAVVALSKTSATIGVGQVSIVQPDSLLEDFSMDDVIAAFVDGTVLGLQQSASLKVQRKSTASVSMDDMTAEFADATALGLQQFARLKTLRTSTASVPEIIMEEILQVDDMFDTQSASVLGLQREAVWREDCSNIDSSLFGLQRSLTLQKPVVRLSSKVATVRPPVMRKMHCAGGGSFSSVRS